jgi:HEAT repeat protein
VRHLEHPDFAVRAAAAEGLAALKATGQTQALASAYRMSRNDRDLDARLGQVAALAVQNDPQAYELLREIAGSDPARVVRARAASALASLGQQPPWPGFQAVERPHLDYREAMAAYDPQPGVQLYTPRALLHTRRGVIEIHLNLLEAPLNVASFLDLAAAASTASASAVSSPASCRGRPRATATAARATLLRSGRALRPSVVGMALSGRTRRQPVLHHPLPSPTWTPTTR